MTGPADGLRVLHVTADDSFSNTVSEGLKEADDRLDIVSAGDTRAARERLADAEIDCVVSDDRLADRTGIEFLRAVREDHPELPFFLFPSDGSAITAGEAVAAGATDYVQRGLDAQYDLLAHRIRNAVECYRSKQAAETTERKLAQLADRTDDILFMFDGDWSELLFVNDAYEEVWDGSVAELEADPSSFLDYIHPEDREIATQSMDRLSEGLSETVEYRVVVDEDEQRWVRGESKPVLDEDGDVERIVGFVRDVTERKERERRLQEERNRFRAVFEEAFDAMVITDDDGRYVEVNESATSLFGVSKDDLIGRSIAEFAPADYDFERTWRAFQESSADRGTFPLVRADGEERIVEYAATADIVPGQHLSVLRDITERRERERELEQREQRYRNLIEESPAPIDLFDENGITVWGNEALAELTGVDRDDLVGQSVFEFLHPDDHEVAAANMERVIEHGENVGATTLRLVRDDGEIRYIRVKTTAGWFEGERVGQAVAVDITDRHRYEEMLTTINDRMRAMTRADNRADVLEITVETITDLLDVDGTVFYAFDDGNALVPQACAGAVDRTDEYPPLTADDGVLWEAFVDSETALYPDFETVESVGGLPLRSAMVVPLSNHGLVVTGTTTEETLTQTQRKVATLIAENLEAALDRTAKAESIREQDRKLQRQNRALEQLNRLNEIIREINQTFVRSSSREEILDSVCEQFAAADQYSFAWLGVRDCADDRVVPQAWSGIDSEYIDNLRSGGAQPQLQALIDDAYREGTIQVASDVLDDGAWTDHRKEALNYGYQSLAVVPVIQRDHVESVLVIYAKEADTFDEDERLVLEELGDTIGYALRNVGQSEGLTAVHRTALELRIEAERLFSNRLTAELGIAIEFVGAIPGETDTVRLFFRVEDCSPDTESRLREFETIESVKQLSTEDGDGLYQLTISVPPLIAKHRANDAEIQSLTAEGGVTRITTVLEGDVDVRSFVEGLQSVYPETELQARREHSDSVDTRETFRDEILERLTDRQHDALRTAYYGGFYEWPRAATSAELSEARDIAASTFQYHLRAAERKVVDEILGLS